MKSILIFFAFLLLALSNLNLQAQEARPDRYANRITVLAGLSQPILLSGGNVAATYFTKRLTFEYSHGWSLDYPEITRDENLLALKSPFTTGFGVGYRFTRNFDTRLEFKAHGYEASLSNGQQLDYTTYSIGLGAYYRFQLAKGFLLEPSVRYWPNVATSLENHEFSYQGAEGQPLIHEAQDLGLFLNVSLGYTF